MDPGSRQKNTSKTEHRIFLILSVVVSGIEFVIASYFKDSFIRSILGDFFIAILLYSLFRALTDLPSRKVVFSVLVFTYLVEFSQLIPLVELIGLESNAAARLVLGTSFDWKDLLAYTLGVAVVFFLDNSILKKEK